MHTPLVYFCIHYGFIFFSFRKANALLVVDGWSQFSKLKFSFHRLSHRYMETSILRVQFPYLLDSHPNWSECYSEDVRLPKTIWTYIGAYSPKPKTQQWTTFLINKDTQAAPFSVSWTMFTYVLISVVNIHQVRWSSIAWDIFIQSVTSTRFLVMANNYLVNMSPENRLLMGGSLKSTNYTKLSISWQTALTRFSVSGKDKAQRVQGSRSKRDVEWTSCFR